MIPLQLVLYRQPTDSGQRAVNRMPTHTRSGQTQTTNVNKADSAKSESPGTHE